MSNSNWAPEDKGPKIEPPSPVAILTPVPRDYYGELIDAVDAMMTLAITSRHAKAIEAVGRWHRMTYHLPDIETDMSKYLKPEDKK